MLKLLTKYQAWKSSEDGATAIEYGLIAAGIAVAISAVVFTFGEELRDLFDNMAGKISGAGEE
ncbi:MAG: Flp family type IVb pilin [Micavibrio sp.]|nr:MAG: Flp family type IVb pilin [Micavibrio sp.]